MHEISWIAEYYTGQTIPSIPSMTRWNRSWFQDPINVWTMPATVLKNKVMYRQLIHSVAFVNSKCCTCLRPLCLYFPDTPRTPYFYHLTWILIKTIWFWTVGWSPHTINVFVSLQLPPWRWPYEWPKLAGCHYEIKLRSLYQSAFVGVLNKFCIFLSSFLTLRLLMSYIYGAPSKVRNANVIYIWTYVGQRWNSLFLFAAQCFNTESMQRGFLCHICV